MKKISTFLASFVASLLISMTALAQPANDNCSGAIPITVEPYGASCSANIAAVTTAATASIVTETACITTSDNDDIFYSFTATGSTMVLRFSGMVATSGTATALGYHIYSGACGSLTQEGSCSTTFGSAGSGSTFITGLTAGQSYYLQLFTASTSNTATFNFCLQAAAPAPPNDECAGATSLTVGATCSNVPGTTLGATQSQAAAPCSGNPDDDVWFSFVANTTDAQIALSSATAVVGTSTDMYFQVLDGSCGSLTSLMCSDPNTGIVGGLTPGNTYYIRVYSYAVTSSQTFNICVNDLATPPTVCTTLSSPANAAQVITAPTLTWTATANASGYDIYLDTNNPPSTLIGSTENNTATSYTVNPSLSPDTYYWYVVPRNSQGAMSGCETNVRSFAAVDPPVNDDCANASILTPAPAGTLCTGQAGTTAGATQSTQAAPSCSATGINDDVWYSFTATSTTHSVLISGASNTTAVAVYSGTDCASLTQITGACGSTTSGNEKLVVTGLTAGTVYYARVYSTSTAVATSSNFNICIETVPVNDECAGALSMPVTTFGNSCTYTAVSTTAATISTTTGQANTCTTTSIDDDVWYSFTSTIAGNYSFSYANLAATTGTASTVGMNVYTGSCGALTAVTGACSAGFGAGGTGTFVVELAAATTYRLRLWVGSTSNSGTFDFCITSPTPTPANDECTGAIALPTPSSTADCSTPIAGTTVGATESAVAAPSCSATGINDDVWYSFTATSTAHTVLITNATTTTAAALYSGSCGTLNQLACNSGGASFGALVPGNVYYVRVYSTTATLATTSNFDICVISGAPANDECTGAIALTPSASTTCTNPVAGTTINATQSADAVPSCSATGINDDVWYSFVATATSHTVTTTNATGTTATAVYSGTCGSLVQVAGACASGTTATIASGLMVGQTYYIRAFSTSTLVGTYSSFNICVLTGTPANDDCSNAIAVPVSADNSCSNAVAGSTLNATATTGETAPSCSATGANDDVWYSFVATETSHSVSLLNETTTTAAAVYSGSCGGLISIGCSSSPQILTTLSIGETYYVRVYSTSTTVGLYSNFSICIGVVPANDDCAGALPLTASADNNCNAVFGSTVGATATTGETATTCSSTGTNDDVWYSFVAAATTQTVSIINPSTTTAASIYSGSCGALTLLSCASTTATATGLTVGQTYYVRVYSTATTATTYSTFEICVAGPPANDECANAVTLTNNIPVNGSNVNASASMGITSCTGTATASNDVWYQFTAVSNGDALITVTNVASNMDAVVFAYSGSCGSLANIGCADGPADGGSEVLPLTGLVAGQTYYVRVFGFASADNGSFTITVSGAALPVAIDYFKGNKQGELNKLSWKLSCTGSGNTSIVLERSLNNQSSFVGVHNEVVAAARCNQQFIYTDQDDLSAVAYYRLKITDEAGKVTYSNIVALRADKRQLQIVGIAPNPVVDNKVTLSITSGKATRIELVVRDVAGRTLQSKTADLLEGSNQVAFSLKPMAAGVYYLTGRSANGEVQTVRFIKQ